MARPIACAIPIATPLTHTPPSPHDQILLLNAPRPAVWGDLGMWLLGMLLVEAIAAAWVLVATDSPVGLGDELSERAFWENARNMLIPTLALRAAGTFAVIAVVLGIRRQLMGSVGLTSRRLAVDLPLGVAAMVTASGLMFMTLAVLGLIAPELRDQMQENVDRITRAVPNLRPLGFVGLTLVIGFYEELAFRGFLMTRLRRVTGSWTLAVLLSTLVFTALHAVDQTWPALIAVSILSVVFSVVTIWRRSIVPAIVGHALFDLFQFLWLRFQLGDTWT
ncbi:MAG: type II CAAX endopeptidase family protein [Phycisphaerae bacterium]